MARDDRFVVVLRGTVSFLLLLLVSSLLFVAGGKKKAPKKARIVQSYGLAGKGVEEGKETSTPSSTGMFVNSTVEEATNNTLIAVIMVNLACHRVEYS